MTHAARAGNAGMCSLSDEEERRGDRKMRKPLVEKKRRARINDSLQELRSLLSNTELNGKMENAEVLEFTVKRVEKLLCEESHETDSMSREASERFAAGYIQCMHEVHTFVSSCPGIDSSVGAELLNHLLECLPSNEELQHVLLDLGSELLSPAAARPSAASPGALASAPSPTSSSSSSTGGAEEDTSSELEQEEEEEEEEHRGTVHRSTCVWRPW